MNPDLIYIGTMEGFLEFQREGESITETVSIHILFTIEEDFLITTCLDYKEYSKLSIPNFVTYLSGNDTENTVIDLITTTVGEVFLNVISTLECVSDDDEIDYSGFQTRGEQWDIFRYLNRLFNDYIYKGNENEIKDIEKPLLDISDKIINKLKIDLLQDDVMKRLNVKLLECLIFIKNELMDMIKGLTG